MYHGAAGDRQVVHAVMVAARHEAEEASCFLPLGKESPGEPSPEL